jgi:copper homeostasis protein
VPLLLEVIVSSVADARAAEAGGAGRLEVVRDIASGGLTPPAGLVREIAAETTLPLRVMVREKDGYEMAAGDLDALRQAAREFARLGVDGLVVGFAAGGELRVEDTEQVLRAAPDVRATFHRAFDSLREPLAAIDSLAAVRQIDRVLTSGGTGSPHQRAATLARYQARAGSRLTIVAGSDVDEAVASAIAQTGSVTEIHVGRAAREGSRRDAPVSEARVRHLVTILATDFR